MALELNEKHVMNVTETNSVTNSNKISGANPSAICDSIIFRLFVYLIFILYFICHTVLLASALDTYSKKERIYEIATLKSYSDIIL